MYIFGIILLCVAVIGGVLWMQDSPEVRVIQNEDTVTLSENDEEGPVQFTVGGSVEIYNGITVAKNAKTLNLSGLGLSGSLKAEIRQLSELQELDISNNNFTGLPAEIGQLSQLETLNLSNNPFTGLPYELGNLQNLRVLNVSGTQYAEQDLLVIKKSLPATTEIIID